MQHLIPRPKTPPRAEVAHSRKYVPNKYGAVAGESVVGALPTDHFLRALKLRVVKGTLSGGTSPAWVAGAEDKLVKSITLFAEGTKYFKKMSWEEMQQLCIANHEKQTAGHGKLFFVDPKVEEAQPLPTWRFTSLTLEVEWESLTAATITTGTPTGQTGTKLVLTGIESDWDGEKIADWPVLVEVVRTKHDFGANTGYQVINHERSNVVVAFLLAIDDNGTLSDTIMDKIRIIARKAGGTIIPYDEIELADVKEENKNAFQGNALATGYFMIEFPGGLNTRDFTSLKSELNIPSAGTKVGVRVMERYVL